MAPQQRKAVPSATASSSSSTCSSAPASSPFAPRTQPQPPPAAERSSDSPPNDTDRLHTPGARPARRPHTAAEAGTSSRRRIEAERTAVGRRRAPGRRPPAPGARRRSVAEEGEHHRFVVGGQRRHTAATGSVGVARSFGCVMVAAGAAAGRRRMGRCRCWPGAGVDREIGTRLHCRLDRMGRWRWPAAPAARGSGTRSVEAGRCRSLIVRCWSNQSCCSRPIVLSALLELEHGLFCCSTYRTVGLAGEHACDSPDETSDETA